MVWTTLQMAVVQLGRNKVRTGLTSLGILIGVAAVIAMLSIGRGATRAVEQDLASLGEDLLFVMPGTQHRGGPPSPAKPLSEGDVAAIRDQVAGLDVVAPMSSQGAVVVAGDASWTTVVQGTTSEFFRTSSAGLSAGRLFDEGEQLSGAAACIVGETVRRELFGSQNPLDQELRIDGLTCTVVGVREARGQSTFGQDQDDFVVVPIRTFHRRLQGDRDVAMVFVTPLPGQDVERIKADLDALLRQRRHVAPGAEPDFQVRDMAEIAGMLQGVSNVLTGFLAAIAGVSLLVGGIGIMNIMMVSVTERTREIGIRLAIGALGRDVLLQFLVEAMVLAGVGGLAGIGFGVLISWIAATALDIPLVVDPVVVLGAFVFSALIGVLFGFFPARRAARMRPIDALRHE